MKKEKITEKNLETTETSALEATEKKKEKNTAKITKVGAMLKEMRQQKGVKLSDVSKMLCIRKFYLEAIENSDYETVPPFPYGVGFIRSYAKFLGLNGENIAELYKEETNASSSKDMRVLEPQSEASLPGIRYLLISVLAIIFIYAGWTVFNNDEDILPEENFSEQVNNSSDTGVVIVEEFNFEQSEANETVSGEIYENLSEAETTQATSLPVTSNNNTSEKETSVTESPKEEKTIDTQKNVSDNTEIVKPEIPSKGVFVEVLKETWVEAKDETKLYLSKVMQAGDTYKIPSRPGMILSVGKEDGVNVYINGVLTQVVRPTKRMNIALDDFLDNNH